ncbi:Transposase [[Clostridium] lactatifermentans DSM 14214]|jgi:transposase IS66|uniref:Transposase n=1 Tax=Anaerotignum lactatifermentans DSM 14214 TaxID=1121323 RepID=A0A1M6RAE2_9FIRM|nr:Transposase [[Clostridium] lactatifermentans DSM 14214] [Anaerotignum lactatifermentans DSM 14214]
MPPLLADCIHARDCKPICAKLLTLPAYIEQLENTIKNLQNQVSNLTEMVMLLRKEKFGPSSEKTVKPSEEQLSLFNEAEVEADGTIDEPITKTAKGYLRKETKTKREELLKDLPVIEIECDVPMEEQICIRCGKTLKRIGKETVREEMEYIPAKLQIVRYVCWSYGCSSYKHIGQPYIVKAFTPTSLMNHSLASPSSVAYVMYQKYVNAVPLYRQEKDWEQMGWHSVGQRWQTGSFDVQRTI